MSLDGLRMMKSIAGFSRLMHLRAIMITIACNITSRAKLRRDEVFARHAKDPHMRTANLKEFKVGLHKYNATRYGTKSKTTKIRFH
ncbi:hypothetical protein PC118_g7454 [Phytophthora cactorum]|uniref:Uncharacterized protein n=1 Tax=Phytophthora cactorum TaxID=29920 RepID=A0A8T0ZMH5_9STRA|nr:hypothetical protein PC113_g4943 [Phytophthora cactorum]KAG2987126.1 hypothetical protein PC118_g7454 [Phytophthora cactorum]